MLSFATRLFAAACFTLVLAGPALAGNGPTTKRPAAPRRAHQVLDTVAKAPAATTTKKTPVAQPASPTTTLIAVVPEQLAAAPAAPQVLKIKGIVLNADGQPCPGASVYPAGAPRQLVVTDANGAFALPVPAGGPVSLRVEYFGVGSSRVEVPAPSSDVLRITLGQ